MKRLFGILFLFTAIYLVLPTHTARSQIFEWAKQMAGPGSDISNSISIDDLGNVYITGTFSQTTDFDPGNSVLNLTAGGDEDIYIEKMDQEGKLIWVKQLMGTLYATAQVNSLSTDSEGNIYTVGSFNHTTDFDPGDAVYSLTSTMDPTVNDGFILKLDSAGNFIWVDQIGTSGDDLCHTLTIDNSDNQYLGYSSNGIGMLRKQKSINQIVWEKQLGGFPSPGKSIAVDSSGNVYVIGDFFQTADFDPADEIYNLTSAGGSDVFIVKLNNEGNFLWVKQIGGIGDDRGGSITLDSYGNPVITGYFSNMVDFNGDNPAEELISNGQKDIFILKLDELGEFQWVQQIGGLYDDYGPSVETDDQANIYISGMFQDQIEFQIDGLSTVFTTIGNPDFFITKINTSGEYEWVRQIGGTVNECNSIVLDKFDNIYLTGNFSYTVDFNPGPETYNMSSATYHSDIFIMKLSNCVPSKSEHFITTCKNIEWNGMVYNESGTYVQRISNASGCDSLITLNLTIDIVDTRVIQEVNTLTANEPNAAYQWIDCILNEPLIGEINQSFTADSDGEFGVIVTNNNCTDTSSCYNVSITGLLDAEDNSEIIIYPNPGKEVLNIAMDQSYEKIFLKVYSLNGLCCLDKSFKNTASISIDIKKLPHGSYFLILETESSSTKLRFCKI